MVVSHMIKNRICIILKNGTSDYNKMTNEAGGAELYSD